MKTLLKIYIVLSLVATVVTNFHLGFFGIMEQLLESVFYLFMLGVIFGVLKWFFQNYNLFLSKNDSFENSQRYYNCPRCGAMLDHPGTCMGMCNDESRGVFRM